ncbi:MAG: serine--tRNA ligase [Bdellovibrionales bacterium]|nr:serine--tRNA ligase [Bdellovibrionales bacterium]
MLDQGFVEKNRTRIESALKMRGDRFNLKEIDLLIDRRRNLQKERDDKKAQSNQLSAKIGQLFQSKGDPADIEVAKSQSAELKKEIQALDHRFDDIDQELKEKLLYLPNVLHESVCQGNSEEDNVEIMTWGEPTAPVKKPKEHDDLAIALGLLDIERASKISGSRYSFLRGVGARMERALVNLMLDMHREAGYQEMSPPLMVHDLAMIGTGQLPKFAEDAFRVEETGSYLIPTAEVPVTNFFHNEILSESELPHRFTAYTPCFRKEAGSYGKDTKGLIRQHQFHKVELVQFVHPSQSYEALEELSGQAQKVLEALKLPYRKISLCSGDIGFTAAKTYDLEVWLPGQGKYREISSCSNFEDFQARRANIRFKSSESKKNDFVHTLNGSGLAVGRTWLAILENYQREDGSIKVPDVLVPYMGGIQEIQGQD